MRPVSVLSIASEVYPLIKTGGLADVTVRCPARWRMKRSA